MDSPNVRLVHGIIVKAKVTAISAGTEIRVYRGFAVDDVGKFMHETKPHELPCDNGYSMVGGIVEMGKDVQDLVMGERVFVPESHQEYAAVPAD